MEKNGFVKHRRPIQMFFMLAEWIDDVFTPNSMKQERFKRLKYTLGCSELLEALLTINEKEMEDAGLSVDPHLLKKYNALTKRFGVTKRFGMYSSCPCQNEIIVYVANKTTCYVKLKYSWCTGRQYAYFGAISRIFRQSVFEGTNGDVRYCYGVVSMEPISWWPRNGHYHGKGHTCFRSQRRS